MPIRVVERRESFYRPTTAIKERHKPDLVAVFMIGFLFGVSVGALVITALTMATMP